jgi:hypothetical protein
MKHFISITVIVYVQFTKKYLCNDYAVNLNLICSIYAGCMTVLVQKNVQKFLKSFMVLVQKYFFLFFYLSAKL